MSRNKYSEEELSALWATYVHKPTEEDRNKLAEYYFPFVKKIAVKLAEKLNWQVQPDELTSLGVDGLLNSIDSFDPCRNIKFESFANRRIKGSMIDGLRRDDQVPRSVRIASEQFEKHKQRMQSHLGRRISDVELVSRVGMEEKDFHRNHRKYAASAIGSLDTHTDEESGDDIRQDSNENLVDRGISSPDGRIRRQQFFSKLMGTNFTKKERRIVYLYYYAGMTMDRVAKVIGLSESRVSQMHKKIMERLRDVASRNPSFFDENIYRFVDNASNNDPLF